MEDTNTERTVRNARRKKRERRYRIRNRKRCPNCGEEYSHSSFYTHNCRTDCNDQEDEAFSLLFPTMTTPSSSDSEFYVSCSDREASSNEATVVESEPQLMQQSLFDCSIASADLATGII